MTSLTMQEIDAARAVDPIKFYETALRVGGLPGSAGEYIAPENLLSEVRGWVAIGLRPIVDRMAALEMRAHVLDPNSDQNPELPASHPANEIIRNPNPIFTAADMLGLTAAWLKVTGSAYYQVLHDAAGVPRELWPMPPHRVYPVPDSRDVIGGYVVIGVNGEEIALERREVVRIWKPDPLRIYQGAGDLGPQSNTYNAELYRTAHLESDFKHDATPRTIFEGNENAQSPSPDEREAYIAQWRSLFDRRSGRARGVPAFAPPGFKLNELGQTADAGAAAVIGERLRDQLLAAMGTPSAIVGLVVDVNRNTAEASRHVFDRNTIKPIADRTARSMTQQLAPQFDPRVVYEFQPFEEADKEFDLRQEQSDLDRKVVTINSVREKRGEAPVEWGDLPVGSFTDAPYTGEEAEAGVESPFDLGGQEPQPDPDEGPRTRESRESAIDKARAAFSPERAWRRVVSTERKFVPRVTRAMSAILREQADRVVARYRQATPEPRARAFADELFGLDEWGLLFVEIARIREVIYLEGAQASFGITDPGSEFIFADAQRQRLDQIHADMVTRVNQHTRNLIASQLDKGAAEGESVDQIAARLRTIIGNRRRARTIARTEVGKASQLAQLESFAQSTVVERKQWNTSRDQFVRDSHAAVDGQTVDLDDYFRLGSGSAATVPLDPTLPASDIVNCRCFVTPVFVDDEGAAE